MDETASYDSLQQCLLSDAELAAGPALWHTLSDPFLVWKLG
jgi:hypothetical protein